MFQLPFGIARGFSSTGHFPLQYQCPQLPRCHVWRSIDWTWWTSRLTSMFFRFINYRFNLRDTWMHSSTKHKLTLISISLYDFQPLLQLFVKLRKTLKGCTNHLLDALPVFYRCWRCHIWSLTLIFMSIKCLFSFPTHFLFFRLHFPIPTPRPFSTKIAFLCVLYLSSQFGT